MSKQILSEIRQIKEYIATLIGTTDLPDDEKFSLPALTKAAKAYRELSLQREEWVEDRHISKYIKNAPWSAGAFIRKEFNFRNCFKKGHTYYYYTKDIIALGKVLKEKNIDLERYMELKEDQAQWEKRIVKIKKPPYTIPGDVQNITTSPIPTPDVNLIKEDLKQLQLQFHEHQLSSYIDIYKDNYAMMKSIYMFEKYIPDETKKRVRKWCDDFNYAHRALKAVGAKKEKFIPVKEENMIQL